MKNILRSLLRINRLKKHLRLDFDNNEEKSTTNYLPVRFIIHIPLILFIFCTIYAPIINATDTSLVKTGGDILNKVVSASSEKGDGEGTSPTLLQMADAFKEALRIGSENVVNKLGTEDGFNKDSSIHIPLPEQLETVKTMLSGVGMSGFVDDLELKLNRAAEAATPKAKELFVQSITEMTFDDVKKIYEGPENSATLYFKEKMGTSLMGEMRPIVDEKLSEVGAVQSYDQVISKYKTMPFVPDVKANLTDHVLAKGIDGIYHYIAQEEAAIRNDPAKHTTELLKKVFGK
ncbi:conserved hypothetical protein [Desulfamplus magnetovallimortis]|uniref:DUF4197 domain-containing protein n=1 Tax=Desulfamplus magnetovallimortis TaxID=1246637 RepID=A0A1W1H4I3_9BACT|nr:DUF4197 domain-containing protein [Desulfamplus magnetovallimortis]SLM27393.1 conserved hypothetical protein [Desulfamplus magnetovallimortis]